MAAIKIIPSRMPIGITEDGRPIFASPEFFRVMQALQERTGGLNGVMDAVDIASTPTGDVEAINVQAAIAELAAEKATVAALTDHINDSADAHDASAISNVPAGGIAATDVQTALNELDTDKEVAGAAAASMAAHLLEADPHPQYLTAAEGGAAYQPLDADLTSWAGVTRASGFDTFAATPSSANLRSLVTDESGTGALLFAGGPLGTPASGTLTNCTALPLTTGVTGALAVANGGTGDTGTAWSTYTPTITAGAGTFTSVAGAGRYKQIGKTLFLNVVITITTNGTASGHVIATMPPGLTPAAHTCMAGEELSIVGFTARVNVSSGSSSIVILKYDNTYPGGDGHVLAMNGVIETA
jgi:hypothetical protein